MSIFTFLVLDFRVYLRLLNCFSVLCSGKGAAQKIFFFCETSGVSRNKMGRIRCLKWRAGGVKSSDLLGMAKYCVWSHTRDAVIGTAAIVANVRRTCSQFQEYCVETATLV